MKRLFLARLFLILALTNISGAVTILSESYHVEGWFTSSDNYNITNPVPPASDNTGWSSSTADYFRVYAEAGYNPAPPAPQYSSASASSIYEIRPDANYLRIELQTLQLLYAYGGFTLKDLTDNLETGRFSWIPPDMCRPEDQILIFYYPVNREHQYQFDLHATANSSYYLDDSFVELKARIFDVPEPATITLLGLGTLALLRKRRS